MAGFFHWYESKLSVGQPENKTLKKQNLFCTSWKQRKVRQSRHWICFAFPWLGELVGKDICIPFPLCQKGK